MGEGGDYRSFSRIGVSFQESATHLLITPFYLLTHISKLKVPQNFLRGRDQPYFARDWPMPFSAKYWLRNVLTNESTIGAITNANAPCTAMPSQLLSSTYSPATGRKASLAVDNAQAVARYRWRDQPFHLLALRTTANAAWACYWQRGNVFDNPSCSLY